MWNKISLIIVSLFILMGAKWDLSKTGGMSAALRVNCTGTAARIQGSTDYSELHISNISNTPVFIGAIDVNSTATAGGKGYPICMDGGVCSESSISIAAADVYCITGGSTIVINTIVVRQ
jgi:hypothetical protein